MYSIFKYKSEYKNTCRFTSKPLCTNAHKEVWIVLQYHYVIIYIGRKVAHIDNSGLGR